MVRQSRERGQRGARGPQSPAAETSPHLRGEARGLRPRKLRQGATATAEAQRRRTPRSLLLGVVGFPPFPTQKPSEPGQPPVLGRLPSATSWFCAALTATVTRLASPGRWEDSLPTPTARGCESPGVWTGSPFPTCPGEGTGPGPPTLRASVSGARGLGPLQSTHCRLRRRQPRCFRTSQSIMTPRSPRSLLPRLRFCRLRLEVRIVERSQQQWEVRLQLSSLQERVV